MRDTGIKLDRRGQNTNKNFGRPLKIKELTFLVNAIKQHLGYSFDLLILDNAQRRYDIDMIIKLIENVPQTIMVSFEAFVLKVTIRFD